MAKAEGKLFQFEDMSKIDSKHLETFDFDSLRILSNSKLVISLYTPIF